MALTMSSVKVLGTLRYMPPEQLQHQLLEIKETADIYSLGATLYELAALAPMFDGDSEARLMQQVLQEDPKGARQVNHEVPRDLDTIIRVATGKLPGDRYAAAASMQHDLEAFARGEPIVARAPGTFHYLRLFYSKNKPLVATIAVAMVLMLATVSWFIANLNASRADALAQKETAEQQTVEADKQRKLAESQKQLADEQRNAAESQRRIAEEKKREADEQRSRAETGEQQARQAQAAAEESEGRALREKERAISAERLAQERLASGAILHGDQLLNIGRVEEARRTYQEARRIYNELGIRPVPAEGGLNSCNLRSPPSAVTFGAKSYSPMGTVAVAPGGEVAYFSGGHGYVAWDVVAWRELRSVQRHGGMCTALALTPDGETLVTGGEGGVLKVWSTKDDSLLAELWGHDYMIAALKLSPDGRTLASLESNRLILWDVASRRQLFRKDFAYAGFSRVAYSADSTLVAVCSYNGAVSILDRTGVETASRKPAEEFEELLGMVWDESGTLYVSLYQAGIQVYKTNDLSMLRVIKPDMPTAIYRASGPNTLIGATDKALVLLDTATGASTEVTGEVTRQVSDMAQLPASGSAIVVGGGGQPQLIDLAGRRLVQGVIGHGQDIFSIAVSDSEGRAATLGTDGYLCIWESPTGRMLHRLYSVHHAAIAFVPGGAQLNIYSSNGEHSVMDMTGTDFTARKVASSPAASIPVLSPDGALIAGVINRNAIQVVRHANGEAVQTFKPDRDQGNALALAISRDSKSVLVGYSSRTVVRYSLEDGRVLDRLIGVRGNPIRLAFGPAQCAVVGDSLGNVTTWIFGAGDFQLQTAHDMQPFNGEVLALATSHTGESLVTSANDGFVRTWRWDDGWQPTGVLHAGSVAMCAGWMVNGSVMVGTLSGQAHLFTTAVSPETLNLTHSRRRRVAVTATALSPGGRMLAMGNEEGTVEFWCCESGQLLAMQQVATGRIIAMTFNAQGDKVFIADATQGVRLWDPLQDKSTWKRQMGEDLEGLSMAVSPAGDRLVFQHSEALILMDALDGKTIRWSNKDWQFDWSAELVCFSHDGRELLYGSASGAIRIVDMESCTIRTPLTGGPTSSLVRCAAYSPDGRWIVTGHLDGQVRVWSNATGRLHAAIHCHRSEVTSVAVGGDPRFAFTTSRDGFRRMLDLERGEEVAFWSFYKLQLFSIAVSPDAGIIACGGDHGALFVDFPGRAAAHERWDDRVATLRSQLQANGLKGDPVAELGEYFAFRHFDWWGAPFMRFARKAGSTVVSDYAYARSCWRLALRAGSLEWAQEARKAMNGIDAGADAEAACYVTLAQQMLSLLEKSLKSGD
ncbi:MAG: hypothetical protein IT464_12220 [Planctomycetes bacterium]|nr:hypothetical protein [Planctomycetota bacterium]